MILATTWYLKDLRQKKEGHFYRLWIINLYDFLGDQPGNKVINNDIDCYISYISKSKMEWQVRQAQEAIKLSATIGLKEVEWPVPSLVPKI